MPGKPVAPAGCHSLERTGGRKMVHEALTMHSFLTPFRLGTGFPLS
jgi:hypothetical protein